MMSNLKTWARRLKTDLSALALAFRDPRTPLIAKVVIAGVLAYAFSPIDLIPDPIPVLGYLDDLVILPLGIALAIRLIPAQIMNDARTVATQTGRQRSPLGIVGAVLVVLLWIVLAIGAYWVVVRRL